MQVESNTGADIPLKKRMVLDNDVMFKTLLYIVKGTESGQPRLLQRALRQNVSLRRYITGTQLEQLVFKYFPVDNVSLSAINSYIECIKKHEATLPVPITDIEIDLATGDGETESSSAGVGVPTGDAVADADGDDLMGANEETKKEAAPSGPPTTVLPEVEIFIYTLVLTTLLRYNLNTDATLASTNLVQRCASFNRRSLDLMSSKAYFYFSYTYEKVNRLNDIRPVLLKLYRTSCVRRDEVGQAVLLNLLLRNFLQNNLIDQARLLSSRTTFPEGASNNQFCRFLFYMARIQVVQLEYADAYKRLLWAARKAPQDTALGFSRMVVKLTIIVQLLMGEIPERAVFNTKEHGHALCAYLDLTKAVRAGDLKAFADVMTEHSATFTADNNLSLVRRLGHNVVKIGLRKISVSYSRISLNDIATKLLLPSVEGTEYICAKAIRDGVIDATIDHDNAFLLSNEAIDVYSTEEPQKAFHARIGFCLDVHADAVKAMRYPGDAYRMPKKSNGDNEEEDEKTIEELIAEMHEEEEE